LLSGDENRFRLLEFSLFLSQKEIDESWGSASHLHLIADAAIEAVAAFKTIVDQCQITKEKNAYIDL